MDQLWFRRDGDDLVVDVIGTGEGLSVKDWYAGAANHVDRFATSDGAALVDAQVENLVSAMAAFVPPPFGQTELSIEQHQGLDAVIAANWQARG